MLSLLTLDSRPNHKAHINFMFTTLYILYIRNKNVGIFKPSSDISACVSLGHFEGLLWLEKCSSHLYSQFPKPLKEGNAHLERSSRYQVGIGNSTSLSPTSSEMLTDMISSAIQEWLNPSLLFLLDCFVGQASSIECHEWAGHYPVLSFLGRHQAGLECSMDRSLCV